MNLLQILLEIALPTATVASVISVFIDRLVNPRLERIDHILDTKYSRYADLIKNVFSAINPEIQEIADKFGPDGVYEIVRYLVVSFSDGNFSKKEVEKLVKLVITLYDPAKGATTEKNKLSNKVHNVVKAASFVEDLSQIKNVI